MGNPERRDASLLAAPLRTRSRGVISTIRRRPGRCDGIGNLFQRRVIHPSRHAAVAGISDRSVGSGKKQASRGQRRRLQLTRTMLSIQKIFGRDAKFYHLLEKKAAETVMAMVKQLRKGTDAATAREMNARLQSIEGEADKLELDLLRDLYQGDYEAKQVIFLRDLFALIEKVIDRCRDAGNIVLEVALKYS